MRIGVIATTAQKTAWLSKFGDREDTSFLPENTIDLPDENAFDVIFHVAFDEKLVPIISTSLPVVANAVVNTLSDLPNNYSRINAWPGFLERNQLELVNGNLHKKAIEELLSQLQWPFIECPDIPGLITARTISMIINEAYFAYGENISTIQDIDIAMKLGTNYPYGPFEWSRKIGIDHIYTLLKKLYDTDDRYEIAPALATAAALFNNQ